jgi:hypothetical protein
MKVKGKTKGEKSERVKQKGKERDGLPNVLLRFVSSIILRILNFFFLFYYYGTVY